MPSITKYHWVDEIWSRVIEQLNQLQVSIDEEPLDSGSFGQIFRGVYRPWGQTVIIKLTRDKGEIAVVKKITEYASRGSFLIGFPQFTFPVITLSKRKDIYLLIREPLEIDVVSDSNDSYQWHVFKEIEEIAALHFRAKGRGRQNYRNEYINAADSLKQFFPLIGESIKSLAIYDNMLIADVMPNNIGKTHDGRYVLFDFHIYTKM